MTHWFRPRRYGYGATPVNGQGWAAIAAFPLFLIVAALVLYFADVGPQGPGLWRVLGFAAVFFIGLFVFIRFVRARTDGEWRWRWGDDISL